MIAFLNLIDSRRRMGGRGKLFVTWVCLLWAGQVCAQALPLRTLASVPGTVVETSGLICTGPNRLWTHNDSGGDPKLVEIDTNGTQLRALVVRGVPNIDWEELTQDTAGHVYIGDFGNNNNDRSGLVILKLPPLDTVVGDSVTPLRIDFTYPDQYAFPPADSLKNFDMEAMVAYGDSLYLFSKNRTIPFDGYTKLYRLPQTPGTYVAELIDSFYTGPGPTLSYWICGAALSPAADRLVLVSYARCFIFSCFEGADFFGGSVVQRTWPFTQKEAAAWRDSTHLYLTDELLSGTGGKLYIADMGAFMAMPDADLGPDTLYVGDTLWLSAPNNLGGQYLWSTGATTSSIAITQAGSYWLQVTAANGCTARDTLHVSLVMHAASATSSGSLLAIPNPSAGNPTFQLEMATADVVHWRLEDLSGRCMAQGKVSAGANERAQWRLNETLPPGLYYLVVATAGERRICKVLVE